MRAPNAMLMAEPDLDEEGQKGRADHCGNGGEDQRCQRALPVVRLQHGVARLFRIVTPPPSPKWLELLLLKTLRR
jgi:hypothetical protein